MLVVFLNWEITAGCTAWPGSDPGSAARCTRIVHAGGDKNLPLPDGWRQGFADASLGWDLRRSQQNRGCVSFCSGKRV